MCHRIKTLSKVKNGELTYCKSCGMYHVSFYNMYFEFNRKQLIKFRNHIAEIDADMWEKSYSNIRGKRKIPVQTLHQSLYVIFNKEELHEFRELLEINTSFKQKVISAQDIDYPLILN